MNKLFATPENFFAISLELWYPFWKEAREMFGLGPWELIIILAIVVLIFGVGRLSRLGGELGKGIRNFRNALRGEEAKPSEEESGSEEEKKE